MITSNKTNQNKLWSSILNKSLLNNELEKILCKKGHGKKLELTELIHQTRDMNHKTEITAKKANHNKL
jgi:hypothetical protein